MASPAHRYQTPTPTLGNPARTEAWALLEAARELSRTKTGPTDRFLAALRRNWRLWTIFQASLLAPDCTMPALVRGNLLGLANFIDKRTMELLGKRDAELPEADMVEPLININVQIGEGLLAGARGAGAQQSANPTATVGIVRETA